jgi:hypothetical protein
MSEYYPNGKKVTGVFQNRDARKQDWMEFVLRELNGTTELTEWQYFFPVNTNEVLGTLNTGLDTLIGLPCKWSIISFDERSDPGSMWFTPPGRLYYVEILEVVLDWTPIKFPKVS